MSFSPASWLQLGDPGREYLAFSKPGISGVGMFTKFTEEAIQGGCQWPESKDHSVLQKGILGNGWSFWLCSQIIHFSALFIYQSTHTYRNVGTIC